MAKWQKQSFTTRAAHGSIVRTGRVCGAFAIEHAGGVWTIYHLPTGMSFPYSEWPTFVEAREFAEMLLHVDAWADPELDHHPDRFNRLCDEIADVLCVERRRVSTLP